MAEAVRERKKGSPGGTQSDPQKEQRKKTALAALVMLGFARAAAEKVLRAVMRELPQAPVEELIRAALKRL